VDCALNIIYKLAEKLHKEVDKPALWCYTVYKLNK